LVVFSSDADEERDDEVVWWLGLWCGMDEDGGAAL
jgi:hypothetical protein